MLYSVMKVSESIGLSKQSIYKKLKKELQEHINKKQGMTYIDKEGFNLIKDSSKANIDDLKDFKEDNKIASGDTEILSMNQDIFNLLKARTCKYINYISLRKTAKFY